MNRSEIQMQGTLTKCANKRMWGGEGVLGLLALLLVWEATSRLVWKDPGVLPSPVQCLEAAMQHVSFADLMLDVAASLQRITVGFGLAALTGVLLGVAAGWYPQFARLLVPFTDLLRPIPPLAWIPMAIVWLGLGEPSKWFVIFLGAFFPVFTNTLRGMQSIPPVLLHAARSMEVDGAELLFRVAVPAALTDIATGLRVGLGLAFGILVAAELIASDAGVGHLIMQARELGRLGVAVFGVVLISLLSICADALLAVAIRRCGGRRIVT
jgi:ABC-type nitrate/sulfonate/bicarbonate transport system permease component